MKPESPDPSELVSRLRQQLILAQVRIMELEDVRDTLTPRMTELEALLRESQSLADRKLDEAAHLEGVLAGLRGQYDSLNSQQHQAQKELSELRHALTSAKHESANLGDVIRRLESEISKAQEAATSQRTHLTRLENELQALQTSRSWRWTAWLRALSGK